MAVAIEMKTTYNFGVLKQLTPERVFMLKNIFLLACGSMSFLLVQPVRAETNFRCRAESGRANEWINLKIISDSEIEVEGGTATLDSTYLPHEHQGQFRFVETYTNGPAGMITEYLLTGNLYHGLAKGTMTVAAIVNGVQPQPSIVWQCWN
jgi:hypothetical protein